MYILHIMVWSVVHVYPTHYGLVRGTCTILCIAKSPLLIVHVYFNPAMNGMVYSLDV